MNSEIKYFIEDMQNEDVAGVFAVRISNNNREAICGNTPTHTVTATCTPRDGWSAEDMETIDESLRAISGVMKKRFGYKRDKR